jgi:chromosome segregation ATPase
LKKIRYYFSLVEKLKTCKAKLSAQDEAHKAEVKDLKKKLAEMNENFEVVKAKQEISEMETSRVQKNVEELWDSKERCYETSMECTKKLKDSFAKVGAYSSEQKFIRGDSEGVIEWISKEVESFEEILGDRGDFYAFPGARGIAAILERDSCEYVKVATQPEYIFQLATPRTPRPKLLY